MTPVNFSGSNAVFTKPDSMTEEQCCDLHAFRGADTNGFPVIVSCWELSEEDLKKITDTKKVYLMITGSSMPPVSILSHSPLTGI